MSARFCAAAALAASAVTATVIGFGNDCTEDIDVFWQNFEGGETRVVTVQPQGVQWLTSHMDHQFIVRTKESGEQVNNVTVRTESQFSATECGHPCHEAFGTEACLWRIEGYRNRNELQGAWDASNRERQRVNAAQPGPLPKFTSLGFDKMPIPEDVWKVLESYYSDNKDSILLEKWPPTNPYINHWESPPMMIWLPETHSGDTIKHRIFDGLRETMEKWSGKKLIPTDMYGMRVYRKNAFLENHVDRISTHVISVIMHIADEGDDGDWPLNIIDHRGREHNVTIRPGEMVLYESATCPHGRPSKFKGDKYVNAFAHYKPVDWVDSLRELRREGKITDFSRGPAGEDDPWLNEPITEIVGAPEGFTVDNAEAPQEHTEL